jgi:hypothetical protein
VKRLVAGDISQTLIAALEDAEEAEHVLVLILNKDDGGANSAYYCNDTLQLATAIFMLEKLKTHLLTAQKDRDGD